MEVVQDAQGWNLDAYTIALEGWRRGLTLRWHTKDSEEFSKIKTWFVDSPGRLFSLSSDDKTHYFFRTRGDKVTNEAVEIGSDKGKTKELLLKNNILVPKGKQFSVNEEEAIRSYGKKLGFPLVIKPTDGSFGRDVFTEIETEEQLIEALKTIQQDDRNKHVIVEQHIPGTDYRIYVVGDQAVAAMIRVPANVIGDGKKTVEQLIHEKNEIRKQNPRLMSCLIEIDDSLMQFIKRSGYQLDSVLEKGKQLFLTDKANISTGGDPITVTETLDEAVMNTAIRALNAVPGLAHGAVDIIVDERKPIEEAATVIELNPTSQIGGLLYPMVGKPCDVPAAIIDYYFPETREVTTEKEKMYFDFIDVLSPLESKSATVSMVTPMPLGKIYAKKYTVIGDVQKMGYHMGLRKQAFERKLHGLVLNKEDGSIDVVVAGTNPEMVDDFEKGLWADPERSNVLEVHESEWNQPMKVGFEIKGDLKTEADEIERLIKAIEETEIELEMAEREHQKLSNSFSWKITAPVRVIGALKKRLKNEE